MNKSLHPIIRLRDVTKSWDSHEVLSGVDCDIYKGDFVLITGPNGGGKTTLVQMLLKLTRPSSGEVAYFTPDGSAVSALNIGYLPQKSRVDSRFPMTVGEVVASALIGKHRADRTDCINRALQRVGLENMADRPLGELSGGQVQRALLARAVANRPDVLVLDEPMSYLDSHYRSVVTELLGELSRDGVTVIVVSHDPQSLSGLANVHLFVDRTACRMQP